MGEFQFQDLIIYHYILSDMTLLQKTKPEYFQNSVLRGLFAIAKEHSTTYETPPTQHEITNIVKLKQVDDEFSPDIIETIYNSCNLGDYSTDWLRSNSMKWIKVRNMEYTMRKATAYMKTANLNTENAEEVIDNIKSMIQSETAVDFDVSEGVDFFDADAHATSDLIKHSTGYQYLDMCLKGGFYLGGLFVLLAGPKCGKSFWLCNLAAQSVKLGHNTLYITLELAEGMVNKRISANLMDMTLDEYSVRCKDKDYIRTRLNELKTQNILPMGALRVKQFPTSTLSVPTLTTFIKKLEEKLGYKFKNIFIDYINIMQNHKNPNSENTYLKIKTIAEDLRGASIANDWTIITVTQTNREGWDTTDLSVKDIAESGGLLHTVDGLFGVITNPEMKANGEYYIKSLAMRDGELENTRKHYYMEWAKGRITEDHLSKIEDCSLANALNSYNGKGGKGGKGNQQNQTQNQPQQPQQPVKQLVYKNNTSFKKMAKEGITFKSELCVYDTHLAYANMQIGDKMFIISPTDSKKMAAVKFTGPTHDNKPSFEILKLVSANPDIAAPTCLSDIYVDNKAIIGKIDDGAMVLFANSEYPMDVKIDSMTEEHVPQSTNVFTKEKQPLGIDLENMGSVGLFDLEPLNLTNS